MFPCSVHTAELQEAMRYIAVFTLFAIPVAKGFASINEATNCLKQAGDDPDTAPLGVYDTVMSTVISTATEGHVLTEVDEYVIVRSAQAYMNQAA